MSIVTEADRALAHSLAREIDLHYADSDAQAIAKAIATAREAGERAGAELMIAKPGTIVGRYQLCRKDVQNECFGWWVVETTDGRRPCPQGFISLPNLIAARRRP